MLSRPALCQQGAGFSRPRKHGTRRETVVIPVDCLAD